MKHSASANSNSKLSKLAERDITPGIVFGIDVGIASCGWAVIDVKNNLILAMGSRCFEAPEESKTKELLNVNRRTKRGMRRVTSRRSGRMNSVRQVIKDGGLLDTPTHEYFQSLGKDAPDPWEIRALAVDQSVTAEQAAAALIHIAKHRGFKSNSKRDNVDPEGGKVKGAIQEWDKKLDGRTIGKTVYDDDLAKEDDDPTKGRKRNREGDYRFMPSRDHTREEAQRIIARQRESGAEWATEEFENRFLGTAFHQRDLKSSEELVGNCPFEPGEKRAAKFSYSFERFRLLETLIHKCRIVTADGERVLTSNELNLALDKFGQAGKLSFTRLRTKIGLGADSRFVGILDNDRTKLGKDVTGSSVGAMAGSNILYKALGRATWNELVKTPQVLDDIAAIITFNESPDEIRKRLKTLTLEPEIIDALMESVADGKFATFKGTGRLSAKAARRLVPEMLRGKRYDVACTAVGYDHTKGLDISISDIKNPVVQRALTQAIKQIELLVRCFGHPDRIHVEPMRDVGKSAEVRGQIDRKNRSHAKVRDDLKKRT